MGQVGPHELRGDDHADQHTDHTPYNCHDRELPDYPIVIRRLFLHAFSLTSQKIRRPPEGVPAASSEPLNCRKEINKFEHR